MLGQNARIGQTKLFHQFFFVVMAHQGDIHCGGSSFLKASGPKGTDKKGHRGI
jgi:hypothetical protein